MICPDLYGVGVYVTRPYNFYLNPVFEEKGLDVERIFSYQSGGRCMFLYNALT